MCVYKDMVTPSCFRKKKKKRKKSIDDFQSFRQLTTI